MKNLSMDPTWEVFGDLTGDYDQFQKAFVPVFYLKGEVPEDVRSSIHVAQRLIDFSYFEYKFYDEALLKVMTSFEMSLKIRYHELTNDTWEPPRNFKTLIEWFNKRNYFEVQNLEFLDAVREARNQLAHPSRHNFSGPHSRTLIENVVDVINDIYEDPALRNIRMTLNKSVNTFLRTFKNGFICTMDGTNYFAFAAWLAFIDNKVSPAEYHFYFTCICTFPDKEPQENTWIYPPTIYFKGTCITIHENKIELTGDQNRTLTIREAGRGVGQCEISKWLQQYGKRCYPLEGYILIDGEMVDTFNHHVRQFYRR